MNMDVPPLGVAERPANTANSRAAERADFTAPKAGDVPESPPADVLRDVEAAARRVEWLREHGRELHFETDEGQLRVEVRDLEGRVVRVIGPSEALDIATGGSPA